MANPTSLRRPPVGKRYDPTAIDATGATLGHVLTAVDDGSGGQRAGYAASPGGGLDAEGAQDAVGGILDNGTVGDINFTYTDATPLISGAIKSSVALPGSPTTTSQAGSDDSTKIATTAMVQDAIALATLPGGSITPASIDFDRPTSPAAENDEFENTTLDAKWTETLTGSPTVDIHTTLKSYYRVATNGASKGAQLDQSVSFPASVANSFTMKGFGLMSTAIAYVGLLLTDSTNANNVFMQYALETGQHRVRCHKRVAGVDTFNIVNPIASAHDEIWLHFQRTSGNVWSYYYSYHGLGWIRLTTHTLSFAVSHIYLLTSSDSQTIPLLAGFDFFRRDWLFLP
jgi:hypothetical protein